MLTKTIAVETKLFFREPGVWLLAILLPTFVLVVVGLLFGTEPDPALGGMRWIDIFAPSMVVMTLAILGVNTLPARLVRYREKGVMRRLSTTPESWMNQQTQYDLWKIGKKRKVLERKVRNLVA